MTAQQEEWTEWFQHDGKGCPCVGQYVHIVYIAGPDLRAIADGGPSWTYGDANDRRTWSRNGKGNDGRFRPIIRYRIRKPRALLDLIQLIADLPAPVAPVKTDGVIA